VVCTLPSGGHGTAVHAASEVLNKDVMSGHPPPSNPARVAARLQNFRLGIAKSFLHSATTRLSETTPCLWCRFEAVSKRRAE
jgi:hypothetical protein